jgi:hypothetical protein
MAAFSFLGILTFIKDVIIHRRRPDSWDIHPVRSRGTLPSHDPVVNWLTFLHLQNSRCARNDGTVTGPRSRL